MASAGPTVEQLKAENAQLVSRIAQLRLKLGIGQVEEDREKQRVQEVFRMFDKDGNGTIDRSEFELLTYECGGDLAALTEANIESTFAQVNPSGSGKITFDEFWAWLKREKEPSEAEGLGLLKVKLQSKVWARRFEAVKKEVKKKADEAKHKPEEKKQAQEMTKVKINISLGKFNEARASLTVNVLNNPEEAATVSAQVDKPDDVKAFFFIELALKPDADDMQIGELIGMLEVLIDTIPFDKLPIQFHHSHKVDIFEKDDGSKTLRIIVYSSVDPVEFFYRMQGREVPETDAIGTSVIKFELPVSLNDLYQDLDRKLTPTELAFRLSVDSELDSALHEKVSDIARHLPANLSFESGLRLALAKFIKSCDFVLQFGSLQELIDHIDSDNFGPGTSFKQQVEALCETPVGSTIKRMCEGLRQPAQTQQELYNMFRSTVTGLSQLHFQAHNLIIKVDFTGLEFVQFLPDLNEAPPAEDE